jgi:phosphoenolpyruvate synthase/pyruvate phosphate dikinase
MTITFNNIGKTYKVSSDNTVKVIHHHDAIVSVCGEYFKNKHTGEWLSELEVEQVMCQRHEEDEENRYY